MKKILLERLRCGHCGGTLEPGEKQRKMRNITQGPEDNLYVSHTAEMTAYCSNGRCDRRNDVRMVYITYRDGKRGSDWYGLQMKPKETEQAGFVRAIEAYEKRGCLL